LVFASKGARGDHALQALPFSSWIAGGATIFPVERVRQLKRFHGVNGFFLE